MWDSIPQQMKTSFNTIHDNLKGLLSTKYVLLWAEAGRTMSKIVLFMYFFFCFFVLQHLYALCALIEYVFELCSLEYPICVKFIGYHHTCL